MQKTLNKIRSKAEKAIIKLLTENNLDHVHVLDLSDGNGSPILQSDEFDDNNTFTLDAIVLDGGKLCFEGSSCNGNLSWTMDTISTDALLDILDYLEEYSEELQELGKYDDEDDE